MARDKLLYKESYKKGAMALNKSFFPELKHTNNSKIVDVEITEAGKIERNKEILEYHIIKVYLKKKQPDPSHP
jgi:hypothetical protein